MSRSGLDAAEHGGAFWQHLGIDIAHLDRERDVISADVLDAWFAPGPLVLEGLHEHLEALCRLSPPTHAEGLRVKIAEVRGLPAECVLPTGGSSQSIFQFLPRFLTPNSKGLILDPTYGEYSHVLERLVGCQVHKLALHREEGFALVRDRLIEAARGVDFVGLVNPNSPTGQWTPLETIKQIRMALDPACLLWIDETYIDYVGSEQSAEQFASQTDGVVVSKSMSKAYALSGLRVAYIVAKSTQVADLALFTPPWSVSLPAQAAAILSLQDSAYYEARWTETHTLRRELATALSRLNVGEVFEGAANFLLVFLDPTGPTAADVAERARARSLFVRDASSMGSTLGNHTIRIAVKDPATNARIAQILASVVG